MKSKTKLNSFKSVQANLFREALEKADMKMDRICVSAVEGLVILARGPVAAIPNSQRGSSSPVKSMGVLIQMGMAVFESGTKSYKLTAWGREYHDDLQAKGLTVEALLCRQKINDFERALAL